jgi:hypothetical protein
MKKYPTFSGKQRLISGNKSPPAVLYTSQVTFVSLKLMFNINVKCGADSVV